MIDLATINAPHKPGVADFLFLFRDSAFMGSTHPNLSHEVSNTNPLLLRSISKLETLQP